jgi:hypothetical protein
MRPNPVNETSVYRCIIKNYDSIFRQKFVVAVGEVVACKRSTKILKFQVLGSTILG